MNPVPPLSDRAVAHLKEIVDWPDLAGTRYELGRELDRGGMGVVYSARDADLDREVALKVLATAVADPDSAERLRREARIIAGLEHPGIVPVHDVGVLPDGRVFYAMKLVTGRRLDVFVREGPPRVERLRLFLRICEPVAFAHAHGVVHRDLKPENVMVGAFGEVLVMDWGVAKRLDDGGAVSGGSPPSPAAALPGGTAHGSIIGTPAWMAPEQARGETDRISVRTDVFALGAILYFLLTGRAPGSPEGLEDAPTRTWAGYTGPRPAVALAPRLVDPGIPRALEAVCLKAMAAAPEDRYADAAALAADLGLFLEGEAVGAYPEGLWRRGLRLAARHKTAILLIAAYLLVRTVMLAVLRV